LLLRPEGMPVISTRCPTMLLSSELLPVSSTLFAELLEPEVPDCSLPEPVALPLPEVPLWPDVLPVPLVLPLPDVPLWPDMLPEPLVPLVLPDPEP
jgi:hypothetical protein